MHLHVVHARYLMETIEISVIVTISKFIACLFVCFVEDKKIRNLIHEYDQEIPLSQTADKPTAQ